MTFIKTGQIKWSTRHNGQRSDAPLAHASDWSKLGGAIRYPMLENTAMKRFTTSCSAVLLTFGLAAPVSADGMLTTMPHGRYQCSLPGDAAGPARILMPEAHFRIASASSYRSPNGRGVYIMRGKELTFTRGPKNGERYMRVGETALQKLEADGTLSRLLCNRVGPKL